MIAIKKNTKKDCELLLLKRYIQVSELVFHRLKIILVFPDAAFPHWKTTSDRERFKIGQNFKME